MTSVNDPHDAHFEIKVGGVVPTRRDVGDILRLGAPENLEGT